MASITASTKHTMKKKAAPAALSGAKKKSGAAARGAAPPLAKLATGRAKALIDQGKEEQTAAIHEMYRQLVGQPVPLSDLSAPRAASTTRDRSAAAADLATAVQLLGLRFVLKECLVWEQVQLTLFPDGIAELLSKHDANGTSDMNNNDGTATPTLRPSPSAVSLTSLDETTTVTSGGGGHLSLGTDTKRGKHVPADAREGCLLFLRAMCEIVGRQAAAYVVGAPLAAALDECGSASSGVREAAQDTAIAILQLAEPWAFGPLIRPLLLQALQSNEWRVKAQALERLAQCATHTAPQQVHKSLPALLPAITPQVWDTKAQVSKAARTALLAICQTNVNPDIKPAIPAVVNAICKPADTNKAVSELMGTTFVVPVDAPTLAILCPVLARALKEKLAIHKRAACLVIANMSKLVESPSAVAPFGSLLVPELQRVSENVQFAEIRDEALKALAQLTKALGESYKVDQDATHAAEMQAAGQRAKEEQDRIQAQQAADAAHDEERRQQEAAEREQFKQAMNAQRELDRLAAEEAEAKRKAEELAREKAKLSTKGATGKCQACGLKKCKKGCVFAKK